jgi:hypothetical protein
MQTTPKTKEDRSAVLAKLGFAIQVSGPFPGVEEEGHEKPWVHIAYTVRLTHNDKEILVTPYRMGVGHVDIKKPVRSWMFKPDEEALLYTWQKKPHAEFKDKQLHAEVACKLAQAQKVTPSLADVLYSLLMDATAYGQTFEDWCCEFGYDTDSRRAEKTFRTCEAIGRRLAKVDKDTLAAAREILQDY